ncbi:prepilin-type N-terminal cleavage/methylation domain-containing protein [Lysinibacillus piscis]|uniref:Prepilin-type N-terminal cleavage/methylation domain-containing protein n=1 Tax=Lysinibacillus piscis TaxID=2518931 RepID=A0ABQ5NFW4_9BACI|nr:prepilin-type N-terminal cleavage/methylation domain-containing protein [Lysinibacillus sp. KH24]GLC87267.1 hypothetical protein LYSBPC_03940 [Lysinibacillus sp. KH24]
MLKFIKNDDGLSLLEVVVALLLIGIILISFFALLLQSNKTTHKSNVIMDATYVAQQEMEKIYNLAGNASTYERLASGYTLDENTSNPYTSLPNIDKTYTYLPRKEEKFTYYLTLQTFSSLTYKNAVYVHLEAVDNHSNSKATMENVYILGGAK